MKTPPRVWRKIAKANNIYVYVIYIAGDGGGLRGLSCLQIKLFVTVVPQNIVKTNDFEHGKIVL